MCLNGARVVALALSLVVSGLALSQEPDDVEALKLGQPKDVASYISRAFECTHFLGEPGYDRARAKEIDLALREWKCHRLDSDRARLTEKYRNSPQALKALRAAGQF
ncbi:MAG: hypothetical protein ABI292_07945 [Rhodoferax sp.]